MKLEDDGDWYLVVTNSIFKKWWKVGLVSTQSYSKGDQLIATLPYYENDGLYTTINRQGIAYTTINKEKCEYCHEREEEYAT